MHGPWIDMQSLAAQQLSDSDDCALKVEGWSHMMQTSGGRHRLCSDSKLFLWQEQAKSQSL